MAKLYELIGEFKVIEQMIAEKEGEVEEGEFMAMLDIKDDFNVKVANIARLVKNLESDKEGFKNEAKRLADKATTLGCRIDWLKRYVLNNMQAIGERVAGDDIIGFRRQKSRPKIEIVSVDLIPDNFKQKIEEWKVDKDAIYEQWKTDQTVTPGCVIDDNNEHLRFK